MHDCKTTRIVRSWKTWVIAGAIALLPAAAFASTHLGGHAGCSCPICSLLR